MTNQIDDVNKFQNSCTLLEKHLQLEEAVNFVPGKCTPELFGLDFINIRNKFKAEQEFTIGRI